MRALLPNAQCCSHAHVHALQVHALGGCSSSFSLPPAVNDRMELLLSLPMVQRMRADQYDAVFKDVQERAQLHAGMDRAAVLHVMVYPHQGAVDEHAGQKYYHFRGEQSHVFFARAYMQAVVQQPRKLSVTKIVFANSAVPLACISTCTPLLAEVEMAAWPEQAAIHSLRAAGMLRRLSISAVPTTPLHLSCLTGITHLTLAELPGPAGSSLPPNLQVLSGPISGRLAVPAAWASTLSQSATKLSRCSMQATLTEEGAVAEFSAAGGAWEQVFIRLDATCHVELLCAQSRVRTMRFRRVASCAATSGSIVMQPASDGGACNHTRLMDCLLSIGNMLPDMQTLAVDNRHGCLCTYTFLGMCSLGLHVAIVLVDSDASDNMVSVINFLQAQGVRVSAKLLRAEKCAAKVPYPVF